VSFKCRAVSTHPVVASLNIPLSAYGEKRDQKNFHPLYRKAVERVAQRSVGGVSLPTATSNFLQVHTLGFELLF